ncbi:MAG TPA: OmpA family protein [Alphaproteobacteria bacterium]|nr:hypothetical protein [Rhodospirillaceae bacterium]HRJ12364.1 OmpA family protein [Alphaproteobacteria bacterium]
MIRRTLVLFAITISLSGCAYFGSEFLVWQLNKTEPTGSEFSKQLTAQYKARANESQYQNFNYEQAYRNADRGLDASVGAPVKPLTTDEFNIPENMMPEIVQARIDLDKALDAGARDVTPREAALAQAKFDCWIEDAAKTWLPELYQECRREFYLAFNQMTAMRGQPVDVSGTTIGQPDAVDMNANRFMLFFGTAGAKLNVSTATSLDQIAQIIKQRRPKLVRIEGHSDASGSSKAKQNISDKRAITVAEALIARGVDAKLLETKGWSDRKPLFKTKNKNVPANRRAEIWLDF